MITLAIDTSTSRGSIALYSHQALLLEERFSAERSHTALLFGALERARATVRSIDQVAIGLGPGSYAGVRIAISAAIGFELALGATLLGLPSVAALETELPEYLTIGDARRDAFYFTHVRAGESLSGPLLASEPELRLLLAKTPELPIFCTEPLALFPEAQVALPSAIRLGRLAAAGVGIVQRGDLEPIYLREPFITQPKVVAAAARRFAP